MERNPALRRPASRRSRGPVVWRHVLGFSGKYLSQSPLNSLRAFLDDPDLFRLLTYVRRVKNWLQRIADVVIHLGNHAHLAQYCPVLMQLVKKYQNARQDSYQQIVNYSLYTADAKSIQRVLEQNSKKKDRETQKETYTRATQQGWRLQFSVHHTRNYSTMNRLV
jgi:hypothetical protein